jgi:hypothetical protein
LKGKGRGVGAAPFVFVGRQLQRAAATLGTAHFGTVNSLAESRIEAGGFAYSKFALKLLVQFGALLDRSNRKCGEVALHAPLSQEE